MNLEKVKQWWVDVAKICKDAVVFMDDATAECLHWHGGLQIMLNSGAAGVKRFSPFEKAEWDQRKALFIISCPLKGESLRTLRIIITASHLNQCTIITSLPERCHAEQSSETEQYFPYLENQMLNWMGNMNYVAIIKYIPVFLAILNEEIIIMPSFSRSFSIFNCGLMKLTPKSNVENSMRNLTYELQTSIKCFVSCLSSLFDSMNMKTDVFSLGPLSHIVGQELENLSYLTKKKQLPFKSSILLVDRILDLSGPLSQTTETAYDLALKSLQHLPGHLFDVSVSMNELTSCISDQVFGRPLLAPGCIAHKSSMAEASSLDSILYKKPREALIDINRKVVEAATKAEISMQQVSRVTHEVLQKRVLSFKEKPQSMLENIGLLQQALALTQSLSHNSSSNADQLLATEKALMQYLTTSGEEVLKHIIQLISEKENMNFSLEEILMFVAFFYQLTDKINIRNESSAQASIMEAFFQEDDKIKELAAKFVEDELDDESILTAVKVFFQILKQLASTRKGLKNYSSVFYSMNEAFPATYNPLLKQVMEDVFNPSISEVSDVVFHSAGIRDYIKSGFSLFMNVTKPQPRDNPLIFLIVLGGITPSEIKLVHDIASQQKHNKVILGCTNILTPKDVLKDLGLIVKAMSSETYEDYNL